MNHLSLKTKLLFLCSAISAASVLVGVFGYRGLQSVVASFNNVSDQGLPKAKLVEQMEVEFRGVRIALRTLGLPGLTKEQNEKYKAESLAAIASFEKINEAYGKYPFLPGEQDLYNKVQAKWSAFKKVGDRALFLVDHESPENRAALVKVFLIDCPDAAGGFSEAQDDLSQFIEQRADQWVKDAHSAADTANFWSILTNILGLALSMGFGYFLAQSISKSIREVTNHLSDESENLAEAAEEIARASESLSQSSLKQASALQQTTAAVEQTSSMVSRNSESAIQSAKIAGESEKTASQGRDAVNEVVQSIGAIAQSNEQIVAQIEASNKEIESIVDVIAEIGNKTKVINDIVFQTKLLSFNASVEAARAGEQGKGFAVVAEEVGNLAQMSGTAAREISTLLEDSLRKVRETVESSKTKINALVSQGVEKVTMGTETAEKCGAVLQEIVESVSRVNSIVSDISSASHEQSQGINEISTAMSELDSLSQQNNAATKQTSQSVEMLRTQTQEIKLMAASLNAIVEGRRKAA